MGIEIDIDDALGARIKKLAEQQSRSAADLMHVAIQDYVDRAETRESFTEEARSAWEAYRHDGRHLTGAAIQVWLATWGTKDDGPPPPCHA